MNNKMIIAGGAAVLLVGIGFIVFSSDDEIAEVIHEVETEMAEEVESNESLDNEATQEVASLPNEAAPASSPAVSNAPVLAQTNFVVLGEIDTGSTVDILRAQLLKDGYIVVYRINSQGDTAFVGKSDLLESGSYTNIKLELGALVAKGQAVVAVLHEDDGDGKFEYPGADNYLRNGLVLATDIDVVDVKKEERESRILQTKVNAIIETNFKD